MAPFPYPNADSLIEDFAAVTDLTGIYNTVGTTSGQGYAPTGGAGIAYHNVATFGPDCQFRYTVPVIPGTGGTVSLLARLQDVGSAATFDGYDVAVTIAAGNDTFKIERITNGAGTTIASSTSYNLANGETFGGRWIGDRIEMWYFTGGAWVRILTVTDATYPNAGYCGVGIVSSTARIDDLYGGTLRRSPRGVISSDGIIPVWKGI